MVGKLLEHSEQAKDLPTARFRQVTCKIEQLLEAIVVIGLWQTENGFGCRKVFPSFVAVVRAERKSPII